MKNAQLATIGLYMLAGCVRSDSRARTVVAQPHPSVGAHTPDERPHASPVRVTGTGSAVVLARVGDDEIAYVADSDDGRVLALDAESLSELYALEVGGAADQLLLTKQGRLFVTLRDTNTLVAIEGTGLANDPMRIVNHVETATEPIGLSSAADESLIFVASGWGHALTAYATMTLEKGMTKDLGREPRAVVVSDDGKRAFVAHAVGSDVDVIELNKGAGETRISMESKECVPGVSVICPAVPTHAGQGFSLARSIAPAGRVFVPHMRIRTEQAPTFAGDGRPSGYGSGENVPTETFNVAVIDEDTGAPVKGSIETGGGLACVLPRATAVTDSGELLVACMGTNEIIGMDAAAANPHHAVTQRWRVPAGPTAIAVDEGRPRALVWSQFDRALTWIMLQGRDGFVLAWSKLPARSPLPASIDRGRRLFYASDGRISQDGRACASCHPDGRDDGLVWPTPDGPRNPPMLAGRLNRAAPYGWLGSSPDVTSHLTQTLHRLGGKKLTGTDKKALAAYVQWMKPPTVAKADLSDPVVCEGKSIYESIEAGCSGCHGNAGDSPDGLRHNVLSWAQGDLIGTFDTPSLRFIGGTAPYFHDGRYGSLRALLTHTSGTMGQDKRLSPSELDALETYVRTL